MSRPFDELLLPGSLREGVQASAPDAAKWLSGASSREVLQKLAHGDPLGLEARSAARLRERALLLTRERIVMRAMAQVAFNFRSYRSWQPMDIWLRVQIDRAMDMLIERDREEDRDGTPMASDDAWRFLSEALGISIEKARRACVVFNDLPLRVRLAFWRTVVEGIPAERCVAEGMGALTQIRARVERAFFAISAGQDPGGPDRHGPETFRG